jgi:hypothetical protein
MPRLILRGKHILEISGEPNVHQLSMKIRVSNPTMDRWINKPEQIQSFDSDTLLKLLEDGLGLTPEEIASRPLGDFFEIID